MYLRLETVTSLKPLKRTFSTHKKLVVIIIYFALLCLFCNWTIVHYPSMKDNDETSMDLINETVKEKLKSLFNCHDKSLEMETVQHGNFWVLRNMVRGRRSMHMTCSESVTFTTHGDYTYMEHLATIAARWLGPVSIALFAPGYDFVGTMHSIQYARHCMPESQYIRDFATFHIYFPRDHMFDDYYPISEEEALLWPYDCEVMEAPFENINRSEIYRLSMNLSYPINVGRNIARQAVNTHFILTADIELYPSLDFIPQFLKMIYENVSLGLSLSKPRVFPLAVFELEEVSNVPNNKVDLILLLDIQFAMPYQLNICQECHLIPDFEKWVTKNLSEKLEIFTTIQRYDQYAHWEPVFVSDNKEPAYDERVPYEDLCNKRLQNYIMCLKDYEYHVLHPAFLAHAPGLKDVDANPELLNGADDLSSLIAEKIIPQYDQMYGDDKKCRV